MLFSKPYLSALALLGVTTATPVTPSPKLYSLPQIARFENSPNAMPIPDAPVGIYGDLLFNGFVAVSIGVGGNPVAGILAQSPPNVIGYGALSQLDNLQGQPAMTVVYPDTTVQYFDLTSFYFGCVTSLGNGEVAIPAACTVRATCISPAGNTVKSQDFVFARNGGRTQNMVEATPTGFKGCQSVTFRTTGRDALLQVGMGTGLDTISYTVYSTKPLSR